MNHEAEQEDTERKPGDGRLRIKNMDGCLRELAVRGLGLALVAGEELDVVVCDGPVPYSVTAQGWDHE